MSKCALCSREMSSSADYGDICSSCRQANETATLEAGMQLQTIKEITPRTMSTIMMEAIKEIKDIFGVDVLEVRVDYLTMTDAWGKTRRLNIQEVKVEVAL